MVGLLGAGGSTDAAETVLTGNSARACAEAVAQGVTGREQEQICTEALERQVLRKRDRAATYVNRGILRLRIKNFADARRDFDAAIRNTPDLAEAYANRGVLAIAERRYSQGVEDLTMALQLNVTQPEKSYYHRAIANQQLNNRTAASSDYRKALELAPGWRLPMQELERLERHEAGAADDPRGVKA
jgi:tetratricopeptide (TPR) repeat protein